MSEHTAENDALTFARALVALYDGIDGAADDQSLRDYRLTQEFWSVYEQAKAMCFPPCERCGRPDGWTGDTSPGAPCMGCGRYPAARVIPPGSTVCP